MFLFNQWIVSQTIINLNYLYDDVMDIDMVAQVNAMTSASLYNIVCIISTNGSTAFSECCYYMGAVNVVKEQKSSAKNNFYIVFQKHQQLFGQLFAGYFFIFDYMFFFNDCSKFFVCAKRNTYDNIFIITIAVCVSVIAYFSAIWIFADCVVTIQNISGLKALSASNRAAKIHF